MARPRKPTHLKLVTGTAQKCRINENEPRLKRERPSPPDHISDKAKTAWGIVCLLLDEMGVLARADVLAVEGLCEAYAEMREARESLKQEIKVGNEVIAAAGSLTYVTEGKSGFMIRSRPEVAMINEADRRIAMWLAKFGLSPADRSRVSANVDPGASDPFAEFA